MNNCHAGIGKCLPNWDFSNTYTPNRNRSKKGRINRQNIQPDKLNDLSANKSDDRKPNYLRMFTETFLKEIAKTVVSSIRPTYIEPTVWILRLVTKYGFRGYVAINA